MENNKVIRRRTHVLFTLFALLLAVFCYLLYGLQVVHGEEYRERSQRRIAVTETVDAARGEILDSLGRVLVSNRVSYQATLNTTQMGDEAERNATLRELLDLCRAQGVVWNDTLAISTAPPFTYTGSAPFMTVTTDEAGETVRTLTRLGRLALKLGWISDDPSQGVSVPLPTADELLDTMCVWFGLIEEGEHANAADRAVAGVLYELTVRTQGIFWTPYVFADDVDIAFISIVKERDIAGVKFNTVTLRQYNTAYAAHLLGRVSRIEQSELAYYQELGYPMDATVGHGGVEQAFESYLRGTSGTRVLETNTAGKTVSEIWLTDQATGETLVPKPGDNVILTLNIRLQEMVERALAEHVPTFPEAEGAAVVVLDVKTAGVLAMASYPTYDLANFSSIYAELSQDELAPMVNRATTGHYAPGSTFKMVVAAGALEEGIITTKDKILDTGAYTYYTTNVAQAPKCWIYRQYGGTHGLENVTDAIRDSCNVFFYDVGRRLGIAKINEYAHKFGLGEATGIELPEYTGVVAGPDYTEGVLGEIWYEGATLSAAIGQENNQFSPLQMANYIATLVNGGYHHSVHLLKEVKSSDFSQVLYEREPELLDTIEIAPENLQAIKEGMLAVTTGTGSAAKYFLDVDVAVGAKTGSAQVAADSEANAVFVAFAPYDDPEIALCIVVERGGSGTELGAIAADIISYYFSSSASLEAVQGENTLIR